MPRLGNVRFKKKFGQNFLRDDRVAQVIVSAVNLTSESSVLEVGCGDGFLTRHILQFPIKRMWGFEIDPEWAARVRENISDSRFQLFEQDFLEFDWVHFEKDAPWIILANLPYNITFPILHSMQKYRHLLDEGVIMVQEEVAQKITKTRGKGYGPPSLFFQHYFTWKLLDKVSPTAFEPAPKVFSRLLHFVPRTDLDPIPDEEKFWKFVNACFMRPRRTLRNNLAQSAYPLEKIGDEILALRGQQLAMDDFLKLWDKIRD